MAKTTHVYPKPQKHHRALRGRVREPHRICRTYWWGRKSPYWHRVCHCSATFWACCRSSWAARGWWHQPHAPLREIWKAQMVPKRRGKKPSTGQREPEYRGMLRGVTAMGHPSSWVPTRIVIGESRASGLNPLPPHPFSWLLEVNPGRELACCGPRSSLFFWGGESFCCCFFSYFFMALDFVETH